jgi:predicted nucleic acid-binding protein
MQIVIDTSALIAVLVNEVHKPAIIAVTRGRDLLAPASVHWEIANAFSAMIRRGRLGLEEALEAITIYRQIPIRYVEIELEESLQIAGELRIYAYDAYLLRCAVKYNAPLLTLDEGLKGQAGQLGIRVIEVAE